MGSWGGGCHQSGEHEISVVSLFYFSGGQYLHKCLIILLFVYICCKSEILHGNLHTSSLCTPNVLIFKRGALLREENGYESVTKRDNVMLCFAKVGAQYIFAELMKAGKERKTDSEGSREGE